MPLRRFLASLLLVSVAMLIDGPADIRADHNPPPGRDSLDRQFGQALPLVVDGEPVDEVIVAPVVPRDCWTVNEFPYTVLAANDRRAECVEPWESVHKAYSFQVQEGGTYVLWYEIFDIHTPTQEHGPVTFYQDKWLGFQSPLFDIEFFAYFRNNVEDISVLGRWGFDPGRHPDRRSPDALGRIAWAFTADADRTWFLGVNGNILPYYAGEGVDGVRDLPGWGPDRVRLWVQRLDPIQDDLVVEERFDYPDPSKLTLEVGATVYREFIVTEKDGGALASGVTASLNPAGFCENPTPGRLRCSIPTSELGPGVKQLRFGSANHGDHSESTVGWPGFGFTLKERDVATKVQMTVDASASGQIVAGLALSREAGITIVFHSDDSLTLESSKASAIGLSADAGVGGGIKLGPISPRAKAEVGIEAELKFYETLVIDLPKPGDSSQRLALGAFILDRIVTPQTTAGFLELQVRLLRETLLRPRFEEFISADEIGIVATGSVSGVLGVFTANRPGLAPFTFGMGGGANEAHSLGWQFDQKSLNHALIARTSLGGFGVSRPLGLAGPVPFHFESDLLDFSGTGTGALQVTFNFRGTPSDRLENVTFTMTAGSTRGDHVTGDSISIEFPGQGLDFAGDILLRGLKELLDPLSGATFSLETLEILFSAALKEVEAEITVRKTQGTGLRPSLALGAELLEGVKVAGEIAVGGEWMLTVTETTQVWWLARDKQGILKFVQISDFPFEETEASEKTATEIIDTMLRNAVTDALSGTIIGDWVLQQYESGEEAIVSTSSDRTETAELTLEGVERKIVDEVGRTLFQIELAVRIWASQVLPDFFVPGPRRLVPDFTAPGFSGLVTDAPVAVNVSLRAQEETPAPFFASEFVDVAPFGITVDPPAQLVLSYLASLEDPQALRLYRYGEDGLWHPLPTTIDSARRVAAAEVSNFGTFVVGLDLTPPEIVVVQTPTGFTALTADTGSGVDPESVTLTVDGQAVASSYDATFAVVRPDEAIADGSTVTVTVSDMAGNEASLEAVVAVLPVVDTRMSVDRSPAPGQQAGPEEAAEARTTAPELTPTPQAISGPDSDASSGDGAGACSAPSHGSFKVRDVSSFGLVLGLVALGFRRRFGR